MLTGPETEQFLQERSRIRRLIHVPPASSELRRCRIVDFIVQLCSSPILYTVLDGSHSQDGQKRQHTNLCIGSSEYGEDLQDDHGQEEDIGDSSELLEQVLGDEGDQSVF